MGLRERVAQEVAAYRGAYYIAGADPERVEALLATKDLCFRYNNLMPSDVEGHSALLSEILGEVGEGANVTQPFWCDYGRNTSVGKNFYANHNLTILDVAPVTFGDNVFIGPDCIFSTAGHPIDAQTRSAGYEYAQPIRVGNDVWFGAGVCVCPGVTIGSNVVIGAGSVVTKDIPDGVVAVGSPCRVLREATPEDPHAYEY